MGSFISCCKNKGHPSGGHHRRTLIMAANQTHLVHQCTDKNDFDNQLKDAGTKLVVVDFFAEWCGPCRVIAPEIEKIASVHTDVIFLKVDVDKIEELATEYEISCMPTFVAILEGKRVGTMSGANAQKFKEFVEQHKN